MIDKISAWDMNTASSLQNRDERTDDQSPWDFRLLFDRSPVGVYVVQSGQIRYANPAMGDLLGREPKTIANNSLLSFIHPDDRSMAEEHRQQQGAETEATRFLTRIVRADGTIATVEMMESPLQDESLASPSDDAVMVGVMMDVTAHRQADLEIQERLGFEQLLANLSAGFVNLPCDQIDSRIDASLKALVEFLGNDRSTFVEFGDDDDYVMVSHSYAVPGCPRFPIGPFAVAHLPWFINQFRSGNRVFVRRIPQDFPVDAVKEREHCLQQGIQSNVTVPLKAGGELLGGLTFAFLRKQCEWPREIMSRLDLVGGVFANVLLRRRNEEVLQKTMEENLRLRQQLEQENLYLREQAVLKHHHGKIVGHSDAITRVLADVERVATTDAPVLLTGETGTGKELLAQTIHELSDRKNRPMIVVNCASLPATLIESELFGRAAGAYTGAASAAVGRFELADGSTLFLDEIGEFPLELQAKLLRVLQDGRFERLGTAKTISVDVRIIAATNRDLEAATRKNLFRSDLFYRLNVFPICVPPLRERCEDIPPLTWAFVEAFGRRMGKSIKSIPRKTMKQLQSHDWPGNIRELSNTIERAMILANSDTLHIETPATSRDAADRQKTLKEVERDQILFVLEKTGWRIRGSGGAAECLDIKPTTLEARMAKLGIKRPNQ
ncbi:Formate hydrogenlyase transcriptional activator [Rhodopirellula maiorica SM1]|uniref:Formate hydrogenlyase transcriptional activator n=1 Tax=Rhodopirellula maiorica SM1 TaxID=1265738 RepID=M5R9Z8_9BACT|nr:sigma 54-interacting transcriptional regulator [Rhodopirellula maiorica]EMI16210.1 Formate hydrogenlyase transcriptional activator [Rhodopirellula maiorica SM1]